MQFANIITDYGWKCNLPIRQWANVITDYGWRMTNSKVKMKKSKIAGISLFPSLSLSALALALALAPAPALTLAPAPAPAPFSRGAEFTPIGVK